MSTSTRTGDSLSHRPLRTWCGITLVCTTLAAVCLVRSAGASEPAATNPDPLVLDKAMLAWWRFDEKTGTLCADGSGHGSDASAEETPGNPLSRVEGVFGRAIRFAGPHRLQARARPDFRRLRLISLSAWARPAEFGPYNEIFRKEDGGNRVLFSFQERGTILSLGLNIGGYVECDARIDPEQLLDGRWHHCAATFDGNRMRVYLDGREIASLARTGTITAGGDAPGCLGSSDGGECFQGAIDDLRLYGDALTAGEIEALFRNGTAARDRFARELEQQLTSLYEQGSSLAETLAMTRSRLARRGIAPDPEEVGLVVARLRQGHPQEYTDFIRWTDLRPADYLRATNLTFTTQAMEHLLELLVEYRPLTQEQWRRQKPDDLRFWTEADALERRFAALRERGDASALSPDWVELMMETGRRIHRRPSVQEAVAPFVKPQTPPTRRLTPAEAQECLQRDWLHQADQQPTPARIRSEIEWTRQLAERLHRQFPHAVDFTQPMEELGRLEALTAAATAPDPDLYGRVRALKRRVLFANPAIDFSGLVLVDSPFPQGSEWQHETRHRLGYMAVPGGRLLILQGLSPDGALTPLMPQPPLHGSFWRPDLSCDAQRVLFCFKPHNERSFHLYEIRVDGTGLVQLTDGPYDDLDPIYLPDEEHILFSTTRGHTYVRCMPPTSAFVLARCDRRGGDLCLVSANNEPDYLPSVLPDGRVIYTRWEYTDKPLWRAQKLWTMHPDGTQVNLFWGNQSVWPDLLKDARNLPGSSRVMFTGSAHHNWFAGSIGILDPARGLNFPNGLTKVTADVPWPECGNGPVDPAESPRYHASGQYGAYTAPYPLSDQDFLVSANRGGKFVLYLMDIDGNRELIYEGVHHVLHALPLRPRPRPPVIPDQVQWARGGTQGQPAMGLFFTRDVYDGAPASLRGQAKSLRVLTIDHKTYTYWHQRPYLSTGPVVSGVQSDGVKRVLGTVPIEADGSACFRVPAGIPLHFQLLDAEQRALYTMRSFANLMPGESRGCLGCHQLHSIAPSPTTRSLALGRPPADIVPLPWNDTTVSFPRYVRPVIDQHCARCHTGDGEGRARLDLASRPGFLGFDEVYWLFTGHPSWGQPYQPPSQPPPGWGIADMLMVEGYSTTDPAAYVMPPPRAGLSAASRLVALASSGEHHDVQVDPESLLRLILWVDTLCPYRGEDEIREIPDPDFQGVDWLAVRPRIKTAPRISRPGPLE